MFFSKIKLPKKKNLANTQAKEKKNLATNSKSTRNQKSFPSYPSPNQTKHCPQCLRKKKCKARKGKVPAKHCFPASITVTKQYRSISVLGKEEK